MPKMTPPAQRNAQRRNSELFELYLSGASLTNIGRLHGLSRQRIHQIVAKVTAQRSLANT